MSGVIFLLLVVGSFVSFVVLEIKTLQRWKGGWRALAAFPVVVLTAVVLNIVIGILRDPTAHNLWPFEIVLWSAGGLVFLGLLHLLRRFVTKKNPLSE